VGELMALASTQYALFTRAQAHRCGVSDRQLLYRVRTGLFERVSRHVFRVRTSDPSWHQRVLAACLSGGDACVASHRTAARLHGFDAVHHDVVEVTVPRGVRMRYAGAIVHESLDLAEGDRTTIGPIPVTTPARTLIDLGAVIHRARVEQAFDGAERDELVITDLVRRRHAQVRRQGRRGVGPMASVLEGRHGAPPKSVIERRFITIVERAGLPRPRCQHPVVLPDGRSRYLDAAFPELMLAWELDGHGAHATRRQRAADHVRASEIANLGWRIDRFTAEQVFFEADAVVQAVRAAIASRASRPSRSSRSSGSCDGARQ
jgi:hypothetical protein